MQTAAGLLEVVSQEESYRKDLGRFAAVDSWNRLEHRWMEQGYSSVEALVDEEVLAEADSHRMAGEDDHRGCA